ncbi:MAG: hypothetical protein ACE5LU_12945 [Anaerolineae bacterium]
MKAHITLIAAVLLTLAGSGASAPGAAQGEPTTPITTSTPLPSPPPPPTAPAVPDVSGTWAVTRSWFRRCPRCSEPVIQGTTWRIIQSGHELRIDRGLRGTIEGYSIYLEGIESDGFNRYDFYYSRLYLSPDGLMITGEFAGSETVHNPCTLTPPIVTCFAHGGYFHAIRRSPAPTSPPPPPELTATATPMPTLVATATPTPSVTPSATELSAVSATVSRRYLPFIVRLTSLATADD